MTRLRLPRKHSKAWVSDITLSADGFGHPSLARMIVRLGWLPGKISGKGYTRVNLSRVTREQLEELYAAARALHQIQGGQVVDGANYAEANLNLPNPVWIVHP